MKIQISRNSRQAAKGYSSVTHQQGRMLTDSDLNEQALLARDRLSDSLRDVIGSGTPRHDGILSISEEGLPQLLWGRVYVDGVPAVVVADAKAADKLVFDYAHQLHYPGAPALPETGYRFYLDVWERSVSWLEDEMLRDPGLHGADTTARTQTIAQVKWCASQLDPLCAEINPAIGNARLHLVLRSLFSAADPCDPCAQELQINEAVGNYLFRAEVHDVHYDDNNRPDAVILKWSSENGAEAYKTADLPPDFVADQYVYEYFDDFSEKQLGNHLARNAGGSRVIDGSRAPLVSEFSAVSASAKTFTRRWDGWCRIEKNGGNWQVTEGFEGRVDLSSGIGSAKPGHVEQGGSSISIELSVISVSLELADFDLIAGDYWTVPVRESVHQQGEVLLEGEVSGQGALPEGELHHYMLLVDVGDAPDNLWSLPAESECDVYNACKKVQFPSLTDLHADDICYDNEKCAMPEVDTVQDALDHLCQKKDLPWHNKHLHGWGIVCGLALQCNRENPQTVSLKPGYALDCEGRDMIVNDALEVNVVTLLKEAGIALDNLNREQEICLYLDRSQGNTLEVKAELGEVQDADWKTIFADSLLMDFYQDCIVDLLNIFRGEMQDDQEVEARCAITECGKKLLPPENRRTLTITNLIYNDGGNDNKTVLNVSPCEHALLADLFNKLKDKLRSRTFCGQFKNHAFPDYPFNVKACRGSWFTPEKLDHMRQHPDGKVFFAWQRDSSRIFVFKQIKGCLGDVLACIDLPELEDGSITDLLVDDKNRLFVSAIVHRQDSVIYSGEFIEQKIDNCKLIIDWQSTFICGVKITELALSPWSGQHLYLLALCKGVFLLPIETLLNNEKIDSKPSWSFAAVGHLKFDENNHFVSVAAYQNSPIAGRKSTHRGTCETGHYNAVVFFDGSIPDTPQEPEIYRLQVNDNYVQGNDGFDIAVLNSSPDSEVSLTDLRRKTPQIVLYVVINENDKKTLCLFDTQKRVTSSDKKMLLQGVRLHSFEAAEKVSIKYFDNGKTAGVIASRFAMHDLQFIPADPKRYQQDRLLSIPVQAGPVELLVNTKSKQLLILNHSGQSISVFNLDLQTYQQQREALAEYRAAMLAAFFGLASGIFQYIKDCFCQHLLVNCPECDQQSKVYLGCLSFEENQVYQICNFSKRKYVKTFPTLSYWMSIIPIEGLISWVVQKVCCYIFPDITGDAKKSQLSISALQANMVKTAVLSSPTKILENLSKGGSDMMKRSVEGALGSGFNNKGQYTDFVHGKYSYKPGVYIDTGKVSIDNEQLQEKIADFELDNQLNAQNVEQLTVDVIRLQEEKNAVEARFISFSNEKKLAEAKVSELELQLLNLKTESLASKKRFVEFEKSLQEFEKISKDVRPVLNGAKPITEIPGISTVNLKLLEKNNINNLSSLTAVSKENLIKMGLTDRTAASLLTKSINIINK
ncbi:MAG: hypothetical protein ACJAZP_001374 [Psychromonas sp.]|jgi:hypothetical protein|uniref:DUF6519 domain-containing protein n=1 Tax=Psychromonas sp. TaxID=1884585 RepID=UPI0039E4AD04